MARPPRFSRLARITNYRAAAEYSGFSGVNIRGLGAHPTRVGSGRSGSPRVARERAPGRSVRGDTTRFAGHGRCLRTNPLSVGWGLRAHPRAQKGHKPRYRAPGALPSRLARPWAVVVASGRAAPSRVWLRACGSTSPVRGLVRPPGPATAAQALIPYWPMTRQAGAPGCGDRPRPPGEPPCCTAAEKHRAAGRPDAQKLFYYGIISPPTPADSTLRSCTSKMSVAPPGMDGLPASP